MNHHILISAVEVEKLAGSTEETPTPEATDAATEEQKANVVVPSMSGGSGKETEKAGLFDWGLIIAFPVIVGTLAFFLFFPIFKDQLAATLPPPGSY